MLKAKRQFFSKQRMKDKVKEHTQKDSQETDETVVLKTEGARMKGELLKRQHKAYQYTEVIKSGEGIKEGKTNEVVAKKKESNKINLESYRLQNLAVTIVLLPRT